LIVGALRHALHAAGHRASTTVAADAMAGFQPHTGVSTGPAYSPSSPSAQGFSGWTGWSQPAAAAQVLPGLNERSARVEPSWDGPAWPQQAPADAASHDSRFTPHAPIDPLDYPLGAARGQLHANYIVAQTRDGLVIVDQHAAHERLVLERLKAAGAGEASARAQALLIPDVVEMDEVDCDRLEGATDKLAELGLAIERFGPGAMLVRSLPHALAGA
ncbi:MAG: DNA mismatch repair protein MutL, partial [Hyphomonas sp.]